MRKILQAAAATTAVMMALGGGATVRAEPVAPTFDDTAQYTAELNYQDDADGKDPVAGANFSYYKVGWYDMDTTDGSISSNLVSVVPGTDIPSLIGGGKEEQETQVRNLAKEVQDAYQGKTPTHGKEFDVTTDSNGTALTQGMPQGESRPDAFYFRPVPVFAAVYDGRQRMGRFHHAEPEAAGGR